MNSGGQIQDRGRGMEKRERGVEEFVTSEQFVY